MLRQSTISGNKDDDYKRVEAEGDGADAGSNNSLAEAEAEDAVAVTDQIEVDRLPIGDDYYVIAFCSTLNKAK